MSVLLKNAKNHINFYIIYKDNITLINIIYDLLKIDFFDKDFWARKNTHTHF